MWIATTAGFVSIVKDSVDQDMMVVRARRRIHLVEFLADAPFEPVIMCDHHGHRDYRWRFFARQDQVARLVSDHVMRIDYSNFKDATKKDDPELAQMYGYWWSDHYNYQLTDPSYRRDY